MKAPKVFAIVLFMHALAFSLLFVQQGCQTMAPEERADLTRPGAPSDRPLQRADYQRRSAPEATEVERDEPRMAAPARPGVAEPDEPGELDFPDFGEDEPLEPLPRDWEDPEPFDEEIEVPGEREVERTYTVQSGDSLWNIARRENVALDDLLDANRLTRDSVIRPGQELRIPDSAGEPAPPTRVEVPDARPTAEVPEGAETYTVQRGDSLSVIAQRHNTTVSALRSINNLTGDTIRIGQELVLPVGESARPPEEADGTEAEVEGVRHTVASGETPGSIANRYGISVQELMSANNISDPRRMRVGQTLVIPGAEEEAPAEEPREEEEEEPETAPQTTPLPVVPDEPEEMQFFEDDQEDEDDVPIVPIVPDDD